MGHELKLNGHHDGLKADIQAEELEMLVLYGAHMLKDVNVTVNQCKVDKKLL